MQQIEFKNLELPTLIENKKNVQLAFECLIQVPELEKGNAKSDNPAVPGRISTSIRMAFFGEDREAIAKQLSTKKKYTVIIKEEEEQL